MATERTRGAAPLGPVLLSVLLAAALASCGGGFAYNELAPDTTAGGALVTGKTVTVSYFDANGTTGSFGIPEGIRGSINAGERISSILCVSCEMPALPPMSYSQVKAMMKREPMKNLKLNEQQLADLTAWLNRDSIPPPGTK